MDHPKTIQILNVRYAVEYLDNPSDVDMHKRESLWGQIDFWTRTIRIYDNGRQAEDIWHCILHEVIHGIASALKLKCFDDTSGHDDLDLLALGLTDVLFENRWLADNESDHPDTTEEKDTP